MQKLEQLLDQQSAAHQQSKRLEQKMEQQSKKQEQQGKQRGKQQVRAAERHKAYVSPKSLNKTRSMSMVAHYNNQNLKGLANF